MANKDVGCDGEGAAGCWLAPCRRTAPSGCIHPWDGLSDPAESLKTELSLTNITLYFDVHVLDATDDAPRLLRRSRKEGWIRLQKTDVMDTELIQAKSAELRWQLINDSSDYPEALGPFSVGHSRLGHTITGGQEDDERLDHVLSILYPRIQRATVRRQHVRDAMHIATAIRYCGTGFVTRDGRLLGKAQLVAENFDGFLLLTPEEAVTLVRDAIRGVVAAHMTTGSPRWIPSWIP